jgi:hypothetical protein
MYRLPRNTPFKSYMLSNDASMSTFNGRCPMNKQSNLGQGVAQLVETLDAGSIPDKLN